MTSRRAGTHAHNNYKTGYATMKANATIEPRSPSAACRAWADHRVWLTSGLILATSFAIDPAQGVASAAFTATALIDTAPFLLLSIGVAAFAAASGADGLVARAFSGSPASMIVFAAVLGGLSPFCSCGVIPLIAALLAMGVPLSGVMAFWLASPVIDPSMFVLTAGLLGLEFAVAKTMAAIALGLFGGYVTLALTKAGRFADPLRPDTGGGGCGASSVRTPGAVHWRFWNEAPRRERFAREARSIALFLVRWLSLAFLLESLMLAYVPADRIGATLGGEGVGLAFPTSRALTHAVPVAS